MSQSIPCAWLVQNSGAEAPVALWFSLKLAVLERGLLFHALSL